MSETKKKAKRARDTQGRFTKQLWSVVGKRDVPEAFYDVICDKFQNELQTFAPARLNTDYTPTIIENSEHMTSTIGRPTLPSIFGLMACVCTRFRDVLRRFHAQNVEFVVAHINEELLWDCKYITNYAFTLMPQISLVWELMFQKKKIYRIFAYRFGGQLTLLAKHQDCNSKWCKRIKVEEAALAAMTHDEILSKRDEISNLLMQDLQTWQTLSGLSVQKSLEVRDHDGFSYSDSL